MIVKELIQKLQKYDENMDVVIDSGKHYEDIGMVTSINLVEDKNHHKIFWECIKGEPDKCAVLLE